MLYEISGIIFDIINGPPSVGTETDARGNQRPVSVYKLCYIVGCVFTMAR